MTDESVKIAAKKIEAFILVPKSYQSYFTEDHKAHQAKDRLRSHLQRSPDDCDMSCIVTDLRTGSTNKQVFWHLQEVHTSCTIFFFCTIFFVVSDYYFYLIPDSLSSSTVKNDCIFLF